MTFPHDRARPLARPFIPPACRVFPASSLSPLPLFRFFIERCRSIHYPLSLSSIVPFQESSELYRAITCSRVYSSYLAVVTLEEEGEKKYNAVATRSVALRVLQGDDKAGLEMWYRVLRPCCCSLTVYTRKQIANFRG